MSEDTWRSETAMTLATILQLTGQIRLSLSRAEKIPQAERHERDPSQPCVATQPLSSGTMTSSRSSREQGVSNTNLL